MNRVITGTVGGVSIAVPLSLTLETQGLRDSTGTPTGTGRQQGNTARGKGLLSSGTEGQFPVLSLRLSLTCPSVPQVTLT